MATIRDVAKLAGVSVATVSRVLNKKGYVHEDTVRQVETAIAQLHYRPNAVAKSLFKKSSTMIALLVADFQAPSFLPLLTAVERTASRAGYQTIVCSITHDPSCADALLQNHTAGYILDSTAYRQVGHKLGNAPCIVVDGENARIRSNEYMGAKQAVEWLAAKGVRFMAYMHESGTGLIADERLEGFLDVAEANGIPYRLVPASPPQAEEAAESLLDNAPYIGGIVTCSAAIGAGVIRAAEKRGLAPGQLPVIALEAHASCPYIAPSWQEKGEAAVEMLLKHIATGVAPDHVRQLLPALVTVT